MSSRRRLQRALLFLGLLTSMPLVAGDYMLYVFHRDPAECSTAKRVLATCDTPNRGWKACSASDVAADLKRYFAGSPSRVNILGPSFANGHLRFCSASARRAIAKTLRTMPAHKRGRHLADFIAVNRL